MAKTVSVNAQAIRPLTQTERIMAVRLAEEKLTLFERELLEQHYTAKMTMAAIARKKGQPYGHIRMRLRAAENKFKFEVIRAANFWHGGTTQEQS